jgi:hypothetical protein
MGFESDPSRFSINRLGGEPIPDDLRRLLERADELKRRFGIELNDEVGWAPWLDTSYLRPEERVQPDIVANLRASGEVCDLIAFVAAVEDDEYFGYWRGPSRRAVADSPLVLFDNEGQFTVVAETLGEAILSSQYDEDFIEMRDWMRSLGIIIDVEGPEDITVPVEPDDPNGMRDRLYYQYVKN